MYCSNCGAQQDDNAQFCQNCGQPLSAATRSQTLNQPHPQQQPIKFYQKTWFVWVMLIFFAPVGIFLIWRQNRFNKVVRIILSVFFGLFFLAAMVSNAGKETNSSAKNPTVEASSSSKVESEKSSNPASTSTPESSTASNSTEQEVSQQDNNSEAAKEALELAFPVENAKRAAVVSLTNLYASDVFAEDGNTYDVSKFHSYADTSGNFYEYYMKVNSWGDWSPKDEQTWHVDSLVLENNFGTVADASLDVNFDGTNYIVLNVIGTFGHPKIANGLSDIYIGEDDSIFLTVSAELINDDRSQTKIDTHREWVNGQFSAWDGSHTELKKLILKNLNDEKSFKHTETTYLEITTEESKERVNGILKSANKTARVEIGDLWITTQFSAKNAFNATVKNTAYGISSFSNNTITLVAIE